MSKIKESVKKVCKWVRMDGLLHIETVFTIVVLVDAFFSLFCNKDFGLFMGFAIGLGASVGKEVWDAKHEGHTSEDHDLYCDFIGAFMAIVAIIIIAS